ncbi:MAG TPA: type II secretion system protein [bacterium]|nr:type II secretion system protein [bacterium]
MRSPRAFTLIELLVVITIIGILAAIALPNYIKAKDKAKEVQTKSATKSIQVALERYHTDFEDYPIWILGGDVEGWKHWHARYDEPNPDLSLPANAWVADPLIKGNYLESYPQNPFIDNGIAVLTQTGPVDPPANGYQPGDGDPRFGFNGTLMGNGLENPMVFANWYDDTAQNIETYRTLYTTTGGQVQAKGFGIPENGGTDFTYPGGNPGNRNEAGLHYAMGGRRRRDSQNNLITVYTHWPGNFFYRGMPDRSFDRKGWTVWFPQEFVKTAINRYMIGCYGSFTTEGVDAIRLEPESDTGQQIGYQLPPPWSSGNQLMPCRYGSNTYLSGGLPEIAGGGTETKGPWLPPDRSTDFPGAWIYGSPDGRPDGVILVLTSGDEVQAF